MEVKLGVFQNSNALLIKFGVSGNDLRIAQLDSPNPLALRDEDGNEIFVLKAGPKTQASVREVMFPIQDSEAKPEIMVTLPGSGKELQYAAARIGENLAKVELQVKAAVSAVDKAIEGVKKLG